MKLFHKTELIKNSHLLQIAQHNNNLKLINNGKDNLQQMYYRINTERNHIGG